MFAIKQQNHLLARKKLSSCKAVNKSVVLKIPLQLVENLTQLKNDFNSQASDMIMKTFQSKRWMHRAAQRPFRKAYLTILFYKCPDAITKKFSVF